MTRRARNGIERAHSCMRFPFVTFLSCLLVVSGVSLGANAQDAAPTATPSAQLVVQVQGATDTLQADAVRREIARELGTSVSSTAPESGAADVLEIRIAQQPLRAEVVFRSKAGKQVVRSMALPSDPDRATETIALLAGNLVRDEAAELLRALEAARGSRANETTAATGATTSGAAASKDAAANKDAAASKGAAANKDAAASAQGNAAGATAKLNPAVSNASAPSNESAPKVTPAVATPALEESFIDLAFFYPISYPEKPLQKRFRLELGLLYGRIGALEGAGFVAGVSRVQHHVHGAQFAGIVNWNQGEMRGVSISGAVTWTAGNAHGFTGAGAFSMIRGTSHGLMLAPVVVAGSLDGAQGGAVSVAGDGRGAQAGVVNVAGDLNGLQLGLLNLGGKVSGAQIGLINVSDEIDGAPVGLINISGKTDYSAVAYSSLQFPVNAAFKMRNGYVFSEVGGGFAFGREVGDKKRNTDVARMGAFLGGHLATGPLFFEPAVGFDTELPTTSSSANERQGVVRYRVAIGWQPVPAFALLAGAELRQEIPEDTGTSRLDWDAFAGVALF